MNSPSRGAATGFFHSALISMQVYYWLPKLLPFDFSDQNKSVNSKSKCIFSETFWQELCNLGRRAVNTHSPFSMSGGENEDYKVSSELYEEQDYSSTSKPMINKTNAVSKFKFKCLLPQPPAEVDEDGDLVVIRKESAKEKEFTLEIEHSKSTVLGLVGLQIWRGALLLADWLLYNGNTFKEDHYILELGSGVGLTSIIASMFSPVYCTDVNKGELLKLIKGNVLRNKHLSKHTVTVLELDFMSQVLPGDIVKVLHKTPIVIAADVIYDNAITEAFVRTVKHILSKPPKRSIYVALEKRYVFTIADCQSVAPCYEFFIECMESLANVDMEEVPLDFPKYFQYDRVKELVLWKITSRIT